MILGNVAITAGTALGNFNDPNYNNVGLLLTGAGGTNGATNNTFLDSSPYGQPVTRNGDVTQGAFTPYLGTGYYGAYFDGTGDSLSITGNAGPEGTENFTVEMWLYITTMGGSFPRLFESTTANAWQLYLSSGTLTYGPNGGSTLLTYSISSLTNQWLHICITRSGSAARMFVNGVLQAYTASGGTNFASSTAWRTFNEGGGIVGNISNLRVVRGSVVTDYSTSVTTTGTTVFTPPTAPLVAVAGTSLLMCQSNRFIDNSPNNFTITRGGDTRVVHFNPFTWNGGPYTTTFNGGSMYFDGSGDYLSIPGNPLITIGTSDFTMEFWIYSGSVGSTTRTIGNGAGGSWGANKWVFYTTGGAGNKFILQVNQASSVTLTSTTNGNDNAWHHIAITRSGNTWRMFVDGVIESTVTSSSSFDGGVAAELSIGRGGVSADPAWPGYISNFRMIKGTAVYTSNFTPPTQPLQPVFNTVLLLNGTNAGIVDRSENNNLVTGGNTSLSTTQTRFNPTSIYFDGNGDFLTIPASPTLAVGTAAFTIEFWFYPLASLTNAGIFDNRVNSTSTSGILIRQGDNSANGLVIQAFMNNGSIIVSGGTNVTLNAWNYIAIVRNTSNVMTIYVNGTGGSGQTVTNNLTDGRTNVSYIGRFTDLSASPNATNGYIDDFRFTPGVARYTANFTPPTYSPLGF